MDAVSHFFRRSRLGHFAAAAHRALPLLQTSDEEENDELVRKVYEDVLKIALEKRLTPEEIQSMQSSAMQSAIRAASETAAAAAKAATSTKAAAVTSTVVSTATHTTSASYAFSNKFGDTTLASSTEPSGASVISRSSASLSASAITNSPAAPSSAATSSAVVSSAVQSTSSTLGVTTITETASRSSSSSTAQSSTAINKAAVSDSSTSKGLSTGSVAGIVVGVLIGLVIVGSLIGWLYRKYTNRSYSTKTPWSKIDDDDITPFPANEKLIGDPTDDVYGSSPAPVIGSRRALALARQNNFNADGSLRPNSDYMIERAGNRAGVGAGVVTNNHNAYPDFASPQYGFDPQGRPYNPNVGRAPMPHMYANEAPHALSPPGNTRQLLGPNAFPQPDLNPVALGRPAPPVSNFAIAQHEDFADVPSPLDIDSGEPPYTPRTATTMGEWAGDARFPQNRSRVSMATPKVNTEHTTLPDIRPPVTAEPQSVVMPVPAPMPLPSFEPISPLMSGFDLRRRSSQPLAMYEDERSEQKRMYGEVASAAGVVEPVTPRSGGGLNDSTSSYDTASSFSAHEPTPRLPSVSVIPPQPYVHGQPLSPLPEVATPLSSQSASNDSQGDRNPYERTLLSTNRQSLAPPYSASSSGASGVPSPAYPPPSPGQMSVPGSVGNSPRAWSNEHGQAKRVSSVFDENDAYGGI